MGGSPDGVEAGKVATQLPSFWTSGRPAGRSPPGSASPGASRTGASGPVGPARGSFAGAGGATPPATVRVEERARSLAKRSPEGSSAGSDPGSARGAGDGALAAMTAPGGGTVAIGSTPA